MVFLMRRSSAPLLYVHLVVPIGPLRCCVLGKHSFTPLLLGTKLLGKPDDLLTCQGRGGGVEGEGGLFAMDLTKLRREIFHD